jgi:hypothetical protein
MCASVCREAWSAIASLRRLCRGAARVRDGPVRLDHCADQCSCARGGLGQPAVCATSSSGTCLDAGRRRHRSTGCSRNADAAGRYGPAGRRCGLGSDPLQRRQAHRLVATPARSGTDHCRRRTRHLLDRGCWQPPNACGVRAGLVSRLAGRDRRLADRPGRGVLGSWTTGNHWTQWHDLGGRIRRERPRRDRADGWAAGRRRSQWSRLRPRRRRFLASNDDRGGRWHCGRCRTAVVHAPGLTSERGLVPAANPRERPTSVRRNDIAARIRLPRCLHCRHRDRPPSRPVPARD